METMSEGMWFQSWDVCETFCGIEDYKKSFIAAVSTVHRVVMV